MEDRLPKSLALFLDDLGLRPLGHAPVAWPKPVRKGVIAEPQWKPTKDDQEPPF